MWGSVKGFILQYAAIILIAIIIGISVYSGVVIFGLKQEVKSKQETINAQTTVIAQLSAQNAVLVSANEDFAKLTQEQSDSIAKGVQYGQKILERLEEERKKAKAQEDKWKDAYAFVWSARPKDPEDLCGSFLMELDRYIDTRQKGVTK